jgi:ABC-type transport system involved in cytochrome bd biosynthesis fused ATPase/permease subunit
MFSLPGSICITAIFLVAAIFFFSFGAHLLGMICVPFIMVFGIAAFVRWADMTNV